MNKKAFTLVELIVVITIIAILGTIAFVSFQDYSSQARDTKTVSDLNNAHKKIALFKIETGFVPDPDNPVEVTSGVGNIISHQGEFGTNVKRILNYGETIVDPEGNNYKYAVNSKKSQYSVIGFLETPTAHIFSTQTFAENKGKYLFSKGDDVITLLDNNNNFVTGDILNISNDHFAYLGKKRLPVETNKVTLSSCKEILDLNISKTDGVYPIYINGATKNVYCDMTTNGGGWTLAYKYDGDPTQNDLFANEDSFGDISNINTTEAKLATTDMKTLMENNKELRFQSLSKNNTFLMKYSDISKLSMNIVQSYNISIRKTSRPEGLWTPYYNSHPHFVLFAGITTNRYPDVCLKNTYDRTEYGVYFEDKKRWRTYCLDNSSTWSPFIKRAGGQNGESGLIWLR